MIDNEFGEIEIRRYKLARRSKISISINGRIRVTIPYYSPDFAVKRLIRENRETIREMLKKYNQSNSYYNGQLIGKSHTLLIQNANTNQINVYIENNYIIANLPKDTNINSLLVQNEIRKIVLKILKKQAKAYLPRRITFLAEKYNFEFTKLRLSHTRTRWGSCSSSGTISLNIALMNLPMHLIDYVIIHELCHTRQMNHSQLFWKEVEQYDPEYKKHVEEMKKYSPNI